MMDRKMEVVKNQLMLRVNNFSGTELKVQIFLCTDVCGVPTFDFNSRLPFFSFVQKWVEPLNTVTSLSKNYSSERNLSNDLVLYHQVFCEVKKGIRFWIFPAKHDSSPSPLIHRSTLLKSIHIQTLHIFPKKRFDDSPYSRLLK